MSLLVADTKYGALTSGSLTMNSNCGVGDLIVVWYYNGTPTSSVITDSANSGSYTQPASCTNTANASTNVLAMAYMVCTVASASPPVVSFAGATSGAAQIARITGFTGTATLDTGTPSFAKGTSVLSVSNSAVTGQPNEILFGFGYSNNALIGTASGWTALMNGYGSATSALYQLSTSAGTYPFNLTVGSASNLTSFTAGFYDAGSAPAGQKGGMFFADNFRPKIPAVAAAMFMPLSWSINRRNKRAVERRIVVPGRDE